MRLAHAPYFMVVCLDIAPLQATPRKEAKYAALKTSASFLEAAPESADLDVCLCNSWV